MTLVAYDVKTGEPIPIGSGIIDSRGNVAILVEVVRVNEMRYGGYRSGKVVGNWDGYTRCVYDKVFGLEVRNTDWEEIEGVRS